MPTNEERREIAENLRNMTVYGGCRYAEQFYELLRETVVYSWDFHGFEDVAERLADLIEPEPVCVANITITAEQVEKIKADVLKELEQPERTCKNEYDYWHMFECSNCGCEVFGGDEYGHNSSHGSFNYCPNCGARVMNDAD